MDFEEAEGYCHVCQPDWTVAASVDLARGDGAEGQVFRPRDVLLWSFEPGADGHCAVFVHQSARGRSEVHRLTPG